MSSLRSGLYRQAKVKVGMRGEDAKRIWERRAPLTPDAVYNLVSSGKATVEVVSNARRVFNDMEYRKAGASVVPSLTDPDIILGIKEPPISEVHRLAAAKNVGNQTHLMFSHTAKGQPYNTPLLASFVAPSARLVQSYSHPRLVDYELLTNETDGKRTVGFGWFAGVAGVLESLSAMAHSHLELGIASPFLYTPRPHTLPSLTKLRDALRQIGSVIATQGTPSELGPFIFGLTGKGQVAQGCLSMLAELPIEKVEVADLESLISRWKSADVDLRKIYLVHAKPEDYLIRLDGGQYDRDHYYQSPQSYHSVFCDKVAPYLTLFLNGTGWSPSFPRLMTNDQLAIALTRAQALGGARCTNIGDISCDVEGGLEFLTKATTLSSPFYTVRPKTLPAHLPPVQMMSVDILPASIPLDASVHFSAALHPYLSDLINYYGSPVPTATTFPTALERATIAAGGGLKERHRWLQSGVDSFHQRVAQAGAGLALMQEEEAGPMKQLPTLFAFLESEPDKNRKRVLMLGSGMVAGPAVDMIARHPKIDLTIASDSSVELQRLVGPHLNVKFRVVDAGNPSTYASLVEEADVVISLLPATMHVDVAKQCLTHRKHLVTASYISPQMEALDKIAKKRDILLLNEVGLDPGIDHCSALDLLVKLKKENKSPLSFTSFCGGLPVPEDARVPLGYKFSWRPQGVLTAALNSAKYLLDKRVVEVPGERLLKSYFPDVPITKDFKLEGLPNRNSLEYAELYNPGNYLRTFVRGTLRYPGFSQLMNSFSSIGLLNTSARIQLENWESFVYQCLTHKYNQGKHPAPALTSIIPQEDIAPLHNALEWLGLAQSEMLQPVNSGPMPPLPKGKQTPLDLFAYLLSHKLKYQPDERDMVVLSHEIITSGRVPGRESEGYVKEVHTSTLITKGTMTHNVGYKGERPASAMARTVGIPVAIAAIMVAEGRVKHRGVVRPVHRDIYAPILEGLDDVGLRAEERMVAVGVARTVEDRLRLRESERLVEGMRPLIATEHDLDSDKGWKENEVLL
ncbi:hypothetical protein GALMADRAFT_253543 [Galerina marginata CBS 339.88]|uniref:Alanine dehydrogenase/pyridine nucleotide transhydrogenase N-terminal domain-containing protein n=1 Tax=Galerina marginata (strain CBS 339.88) TaxID=685588 RepID=A0A067SP28_GALM3|nr:hypothetical protein GALMADRAFT_253543 [Galerina marginata CBS 339.88]